MVFPASATVKVVESELALQPSYCSMGSGQPYQKHTPTSSTAGNLRPWVGAQVIGTVDIGLVKVACSKAGVSFHENIQIYFYSGGNSEFCYGSIRWGFCWRACKGWSAVDKLAFAALQTSKCLACNRPYYNINALVEFVETALFGQATIWDSCYLHGLPGFGGLWGT